MYSYYILFYQSLFMQTDPKIQTNKQRLHKVLQFLQYHRIGVQEIWSQSPQLTICQFANIIEQKFGYKLNTDELLGLKSIASQEQLLYVQNFHHLGIWSDLFYEKQYKKVLSCRQRQRPRTAASSINKYKQEVEAYLPAQSKISRNMTQTRVENFIKNSRHKLNQEHLQKKIVQNALDKKWEYLIKVGEMNSWIKDAKTIQLTSSRNIKPLKVQKNQMNKIYKIETNQQDIKIVEEKQNGNGQLLPLKVFDQKYLSMKKKIIGEQKTKNNMKGTMLLVLDKKDKVSKAKLGEKISQRDQQINYLLLQVIRLKTIFQQQDQILTECEVNI